MQGKKQKINMF